MQFGNTLIIGDSYSTFEGYNPEGYAVYYTEKEGATDVRRVEETWWHQLQAQTDCSILLNNSWSGSTICYTGYNNVDCSQSSSFIYRLNCLIDQDFFLENRVDTILIFGGTNDSWAGVEIGELQYGSWTKADLHKVLPAVSFMMHRLQTAAPKANIYWLINTDLNGEIEAGMLEACAHYKIQPIHFGAIDKTSGHPTVKGMQDIKNQLIEKVPNPFKIGTYIAGWNESGIKKLRYNCLDFINYAFAIPTEEGDILPLANPDFVHKVVKEAHEHGVQVFISVGGWSWKDVPLEATFEKATETPEKIKRLAAAITAVVDEFDFDGADIDWEYPRVHTAAANEKLLELLSVAMTQRGKMLTAAVFAGVSALDNGNDHLGNSVKDIVYGFTDHALELFDWINLMVYDGGNGALHSSYDFALRSGRMWRDERKVPAKKLVLGVLRSSRWCLLEDIGRSSGCGSA